MTEKEQDAYNEWMLLFGFRWVELHELNDNNGWNLLKILIDSYTQYHYDGKTDKATRRLRQPHEIT